MEYVAVIKDNDIVNIVTVDDKDSIGALKIFLPEMDDFVLVTDETGPAFIGGTILNNKFVPPAPYESWIFDENDFIWKSPVPYPEDNNVYSWDEDASSWILVDVEVL